MFLLLDHPWVYLKMGYCYSSQLSWTVNDGLPHHFSLHNTFLPPWELYRRKETVLAFNVSVLPSRSGRQLRATEIACIVLGGLWGNQQLKGRYFIPGYRLFIWQSVASTLNHIIFFPGSLTHCAIYLSLQILGISPASLIPSIKVTFCFPIFGDI